MHGCLVPNYQGRWQRRWQLPGPLPHAWRMEALVGRGGTRRQRLRLFSGIVTQIHYGWASAPAWADFVSQARTGNGGTVAGGAKTI